MGSTEQKRQSGTTLVELVVAIAIMAILATGVLPITRTMVKRQREKELRVALWQMRDAIDHFKDYADLSKIPPTQIKLGSEGYPPDLDTLVKGVDMSGKKVRFLRHIPMDPMTHSTEWGLRSMQDDPASESWGGQSVFDVYTKSQGTGLDGTKYSDW
jgi:general secretion pathway protein G